MECICIYLYYVNVNSNKPNSEKNKMIANIQRQHSTNKQQTNKQYTTYKTYIF